MLRIPNTSWGEQWSVTPGPGTMDGLQADFLECLYWWLLPYELHTRGPVGVLMRMPPIGSGIGALSSRVGDAVCGDLGGAALPKEVCHRRRAFFFFFFTSCLSLCFMLAFEDVVFQFPASTAMTGTYCLPSQHLLTP